MIKGKGKIGIPDPINLTRWLEENEEHLQPPICNRCIQKGEELMAMVVIGPNDRTDFHVNPTEEWFYQVKGRLELTIMETDAESQVSQSVKVLNEGDTFLLPALVPHRPRRLSASAGIVIERRRPPGSLDELRWYCEKCLAIIHEIAFTCSDMEEGLRRVVKEGWSGRRLCPDCSTDT